MLYRNLFLTLGLLSLSLNPVLGMEKAKNAAHQAYSFAYNLGQRWTDVGFYVNYQFPFNLIAPWMVASKYFGKKQGVVPFAGTKALGLGYATWALSNHITDSYLKGREILAHPLDFMRNAFGNNEVAQKRIAAHLQEIRVRDRKIREEVEAKYRINVTVPEDVEKAKITMNIPAEMMENPNTNIHLNLVIPEDMHLSKIQVIPMHASKITTPASHQKQHTLFNVNNLHEKPI